MPRRGIGVLNNSEEYRLAWIFEHVDEDAYEANRLALSTPTHISAPYIPTPQNHHTQIPTPIFLVKLGWCRLVSEVKNSGVGDDDILYLFGSPARVSTLSYKKLDSTGQAVERMALKIHAFLVQLDAEAVEWVNSQHVQFAQTLCQGSVVVLFSFLPVI